MGHSGNLENIQLQNQPEGEPKTDLADQAVFEAQERIRQELKEAQNQSDDQFFSMINIGNLHSTALMVLHKLVELGDPFPKKLLMKEEVRTAQESPLYADKMVYDNPKERKEYIDEFLGLYSDKIKEWIAQNPNEYYTADLLPEKKSETNYQAPQADI